MGEERERGRGRHWVVALYVIQHKSVSQREREREKQTD